MELPLDNRNQPADSGQLDTKVSVKIEGDSRKLVGHKGDTLLDLLQDNGVRIENECGGNCSCTTCLVTILAGEYNLSLKETPEEERLSTLEDRTEFSRLSCQTLILRGEVTLQI